MERYIYRVGKEGPGMVVKETTISKMITEQIPKTKIVKQMVQVPKTRMIIQLVPEEVEVTNEETKEVTIEMQEVEKEVEETYYVDEEKEVEETYYESVEKEVVTHVIAQPLFPIMQEKKVREGNSYKVETLEFNFETEKQEVTNTKYENVPQEILQQEIEEEYVPRIEKYQTLGLISKVEQLQQEFLTKYEALTTGA